MPTRFDSVSALRRVASDAPLLDADEERELLRRVQEEDDQAALERLCVAHLRMVFAAAKRFAVPSIPTEDLIAEGSLALTEAARRFDRSKNVRFGTYAAWWIRGLIRRYTLANRRVVGTPSTRHARKLLAHLRTTERAMTAELGHPPTAEQVAERLRVGVEDVREVRAALGARDVAIGVDRDGLVFELPSGGPSPEELVAERERRSLTKEQIERALEQLGSRERLVLERRLLQTESETLANLGKILGLSGERVRQIEKAGRQKLRSALSTAAA